MRGAGSNRSNARSSLLLTAVALAALLWIINSLVDAFVFGQNTLVHSLFP